jgi:predicted 3-demethylubiquinone-9 3-methyltransferase (glyoxalase superfamily)
MAEHYRQTRLGAEFIPAPSELVCAAMQSLAPCLMFVGDQCGNADEAMELYVSTFDASRVVSVERFGPEDEGQRGIKRARFELIGREVIAMDSAGPHQFSFTPATSMVVEFDSEEQLDSAWARLVQGGTELMPLQAYDFSPKFGWLQDRFGVSWQMNLVTT